MHTQLAQLSDNIRNMQAEVVENMNNVFIKTFELLRSDGILRHEEYAGQHEQIIHILQLACIYWTPYS